MKTETLDTLCANVTLTLKPGKPSPEFPDGHHYSATLGYQGRCMTTPFHTGSGWTTDPTAHDVLECLLSDADSAQESFGEWCANRGYDSDSRKAERTYKACQRIRGQLQKLLGADFERFTYADRF
jgi:hypothetical protein